MRSNREIDSLKLVKQLMIQQLGNITIKETNDQYAHYDLFADYKGQRLFIEVKERIGRYIELENFIKYSKFG